MSIPRNTYKDRQQNAADRDNAGTVTGYVSEETQRVMATPGDDDAPYVIAHGRASRDGASGLVEERDGAAQRLAVDELGRLWTRVVGGTVDVDIPVPLPVTGTVTATLSGPVPVVGPIDADARLDVADVSVGAPPPYTVGPAQAPRPVADRRGFAYTVPAGYGDVVVRNDSEPTVLFDLGLASLGSTGPNWAVPPGAPYGFLRNVGCSLRRAHFYVLAEGTTISASPTEHTAIELKPFLSPHPEPLSIVPPSDAWFSPGIFEPLYTLDIPGNAIGSAASVYNVTTGLNLLPREARIDYRESRFRIPVDSPIAGQRYRVHVALPPIDISGAQAITVAFRFVGTALSALYSDFRMRVVAVLSV